VSGVASGSPKQLSGDVLENHQEEGRVCDANESHFPVLVVGRCNSTDSVPQQGDFPLKSDGKTPCWGADGNGGQNLVFATVSCPTVR